MNPNALQVLLFIFVVLAPVPAAAQVPAELDALWARVIESVRTGDPELYLSTYHPDAIFVSARRGITRQVSADVEANADAWADTREGRTQRGLEFRFTDRLHSEDSALEVGIFRYSSTEADGSTRVVWIHFEAALVKKDGRWLQLLEYQKSDASLAEWEAAGSGY